MSAGRDQDSFTSPACLLADVDDAYAGYWTREEVGRLLDLLREREQASIELLRDALPRIRDDALHAQLKQMLDGHERNLTALQASSAT